MVTYFLEGPRAELEEKDCPPIAHIDRVLALSHSSNSSLNMGGVGGSMSSVGQIISPAIVKSVSAGRIPPGNHTSNSNNNDNTSNTKNNSCSSIKYDVP